MTVDEWESIFAAYAEGVEADEAGRLEWSKALAALAVALTGPATESKE